MNFPLVSNEFVLTPPSTLKRFIFPPWLPVAMFSESVVKVIVQMSTKGKENKIYIDSNKDKH